VWTKSGAGPAMLANDRNFALFMKMHGTYNASTFAFPTSYAFFGNEFHTTTIPLFKGPGRARLIASRIPCACQTYNSDKVALHASFGFDFYGAFGDGMAMMIDSCTCKHTGKATDTFFHSIRLQYFWHFITSHIDSLII
jgi:hypothetical protein